MFLLIICNDWSTRLRLMLKIRPAASVVYMELPGVLRQFFGISASVAKSGTGCPKPPQIASEEAPCRVSQTNLRKIQTNIGVQIFLHVEGKVQAACTMMFLCPLVFSLEQQQFSTLEEEEEEGEGRRGGSLSSLSSHPLSLSLSFSLIPLPLIPLFPLFLLLPTSSSSSC